MAKTLEIVDISRRKRRHRRRRYRRRRNAAGARVNAVSARAGQLPLPNRILCRHRYVETLTTNSGANTPSTYQVILNGLYSPMVSGSTHQPMGFDQFSALYQFYKVLGAKISCTFANDSNTIDTGNALVALQLHENASYVPTKVTEILERGRCVWKTLGLANSGHDMAKLSLKWSGKKWYGKNFNSTAFSGTPSANPSELIYCAVVNCADYDGNDGPEVDIIMTVDYIVEWYSPLQMNQS